MLVLSMRKCHAYLPPAFLNRNPLSVGVIATICVRIYISFEPLHRDRGNLAEAINVFQEITLISSFITNALGTGLIALKAWYVSCF